MWLLPFSRNRQNSICKSKRNIKPIHTNIKIKNMLNYSYNYNYNYINIHIRKST